ncbi:MAG: hypothetical protein KBT12_01590 [Bacteroidales bacterium]|nr:hypothetical protein [Candidatus Physcousia equi]
MTPGTTGTEFQHWNTYSTPDTPRAIYMRNAYDPCSFITTKSAGKVAYVEVDWLHPTGQTEILGVYGSTTPFTSTSQTNGTKLGELRKGYSNRLDIKGNWPYIQVRAEDYLGFFERPSVDQDDVFITSLRIGWNKLDDADVDANGKVDVDDVPALSRIIATGNSTPDGDVNCDGRVTIADMVRLVDVLKK